MNPPGKSTTGSSVRPTAIAGIRPGQQQQQPLQSQQQQQQQQKPHITNPKVIKIFKSNIAPYPVTSTIRTTTIPTKPANIKSTVCPRTQPQLIIKTIPTTSTTTTPTPNTTSFLPMTTNMLPANAPKTYILTTASAPPTSGIQHLTNDVILLPPQHLSATNIKTTQIKRVPTGPYPQNDTPRLHNILISNNSNNLINSTGTYIRPEVLCNKELLGRYVDGQIKTFPNKQVVSFPFSQTETSRVRGLTNLMQTIGDLSSAGTIVTTIAPSMQTLHTPPAYAVEATQQIQRSSVEKDSQSYDGRHSKGNEGTNEKTLPEAMATSTDTNDFVVIIEDDDDDVDEEHVGHNNNNNNNNNSKIININNNNNTNNNKKANDTLVSSVEETENVPKVAASPSRKAIRSKSVSQTLNAQHTGNERRSSEGSIGSRQLTASGSLELTTAKDTTTSKPESPNSSSVADKCNEQLKIDVDDDVTVSLIPQSDEPKQITSNEQADIIKEIYDVLDSDLLNDDDADVSIIEQNDEETNDDGDSGGYGDGDGDPEDENPKITVINLINDSGDLEPEDDDVEEVFVTEPQKSSQDSLSSPAKSIESNEALAVTPPIRNKDVIMKEVAIQHSPPSPPSPPTPPPKAETKPPSQAQSQTQSQMQPKPIRTELSKYSDVNISTALHMVSTFNMLDWRGRVGNTDNDGLRFHLNEFNLLQLYEKGTTQKRIRGAYEKPIYERESIAAGKNGEKVDQVLYLCRSCNCHGPADDFLAPEFCSLECLRHGTRKRHRELIPMKTKRARKIETNKVQTSALNAGQQQQQLQMHQVQPDTTTILTTQGRSQNSGPKREQPPKTFNWSTYLMSKGGDVAAPGHLFLNPLPTDMNYFKVGMKLEAIDPDNCSLFCVCTVVEVQGYRIKLSFDGYMKMYDFWVNADSPNIFPTGWCAKNNRALQPPKCIDPFKFKWPKYLEACKALPAQREMFTNLNSMLSDSDNPFVVGMHLEAEDLNDTGKLCVATVADVMGDRIRVHFDGWDDCYDYWVDIHSPYIHPCNWHKGLQPLILPPEHENGKFNWEQYMQNGENGVAAPTEFFAPRQPINFKLQMKLEVVDPCVPALIRPATVVGRKGHRIKLHLIGWPVDYCFWKEDDSPDLHPVGWCAMTGHDMEPTPGCIPRSERGACGIPGCRGLGNMKRIFLNNHTTRDCCPYAPENWNKKLDKPLRVTTTRLVKQPLSPRVPHVQTIAQFKMSAAETSATRKTRYGPVDPKYTSNGHEQSPPQLQQQQQQKHMEHVKQPRKQQQKPMTYHMDTSPIDLDAMTSPPATKGGDLKTIIKKEPLSNDYHVVTKKEQTDEEVSVRVAKEFLCDYGPRLRQNYYIWQKVFTIDKDSVRVNPMLWPKIEVGAYIQRTMDSLQLAAIFMDADIDGAALLMLDQNDLTEMLGIKLGPALQIFSHIVQLRALAVTKFKISFNGGPA